MIFTLVITSSHLDNPSTAYYFAESVLEQGFKINIVFFYADATYLSSSYIDMNTDEVNITKLWQKLAIKYRLNLIVCSGSASRRGILAGTIAEKFSLGGLGQLIESINNADRFIHFKR